MQPGLTHTRQPDLLSAAEQLERDAYYVAVILRKSRLELWYESTLDAQQYAQLVDEDDEELAPLHARDALFGRLTVPGDEGGAYETVLEDGGLTLRALRSQIPELRDFELVEAAPDELPAQDASSSVPRRQWMRLWFRSQS